MELIGDKLVVFVDYKFLEKEYNFVVFPTIISLDGSGVITHIQYAESQSFDQGLMTQVSDVDFTPK